MADMVSGSSMESARHSDTRPSELRRGEALVRKTVEAIRSFNDSFDISDTEKLYRISSGNPVSPDIEADMLKAEKAGQEAKESFIKTRLETKEDFF